MEWYWIVLIVYGSVMGALAIIGTIVYASAEGEWIYKRNGSRIVYAGLVWPLLVPWGLFMGLRGAWRAAEFDIPKPTKKTRDKQSTDW